jgi:hypothetical protein
MKPDSIGFYADTGNDFNQQFEPFVTDLDNNGTYESIVQGIDTDGDNVPDTWLVQSDINNDGIADETLLIQGLDSNNDGQIDVWQIQADIDDNGIPDDIYLVETTPELNTLGNEFISDDSQIIGNPTDDLEHWHQQTYQDTCAVSCQEFILDDLTGHDFTEDQLRQEAYANGWYTPGGGTPMECMGNILAAHGLEVEKHYGGTLDDISQKLAQGDKVMVAIDSDEIWNPDSIDDDDLLSSFVGMPGQDANHAVQVVGIDTSDPSNPMVILNDPGSPDGQGTMIPADNFLNAWEDSGNFMVATTGRVTDGSIASAPTVGFGSQSIGNSSDDSQASWDSWNAQQAENRGGWDAWNAQQAEYRGDWDAWMSEYTAGLGDPDSAAFYANSAANQYHEAASYADSAANEYSQAASYADSAASATDSIV